MGPLAKLPYLGMKLGHWPKCRKLHINKIFPLYRRGFIFALQAVVLGIWTDFQTCHIRAWNLTIGQSARSCTYILFLPQGSKVSLFSLYGQWFPRYGPIFKIAIFGHETWPLAKVPELADTLPLYPRGSKLSLFLLYGQRFPRYGPVFKIAIFGHETWPLAKVPHVAHIPSFYPGGSKINLIFALRAIAFETWADFQNCHIWPEVAHDTLSVPQGVKIELIFTLRAAVSEIRANFQIAIFGHETWPSAKVPLIAHIPSFYTRG